MTRKRTITDHRVTVVLPAFGPDVPAQVRGYVHELARWQDADGHATVSRRQLAEGMGVCARTVTRWHRAAERLGLVARVDGGHRGKMQTVRLLCTNPETPAERDTRRKARAKHAMRRRRRQVTMDAARRHVDPDARRRHDEREAAMAVRFPEIGAARFAVSNRVTPLAHITTHGDAGAPNRDAPALRAYGYGPTPAESKAYSDAGIAVEPKPDTGISPEVLAFRAAMRERAAVARRKAKW